MTRWVIGTALLYGVHSRRTTISCRCNARIPIGRVVLALAAIALATPAAAQRLPDTVEWSVPSAAPPTGAPVMAGASVVVPLSTGVIAAHALRDGALLCSTA